MEMLLFFVASTAASKAMAEEPDVQDYSVIPQQATGLAVFPLDALLGQQGR